jgi:hypothetical protein
VPIPSINNDILETFETTAVENEIKERIAQGEVQGSEVEYWKVLDRIKDQDSQDQRLKLSISICG